MNQGTYTTLTLTFPHNLPTPEKEALDKLLMEDLLCAGIEDLSLSESELNDLLGSSAVTGGPLPQEVLINLEEYGQNRLSPYSTYFFYGDNSLDLATQAKDKIESSFPFIVNAKIEQRQEENWLEEWKKYYKPIEISSNLVVLPSWESPTQFNHKNKIMIDPGQAFGTGSHESTKLCLSLIDKYFANQTFNKGIESSTDTFNTLDFGCGSGILAIATLMLNSKNSNKKSYCFDIDPAAYENIQTNASLNNVSKDELLLIPANEELPSPWCEKKFDLVIANILLPILLEKSSLLTSLVKSDGYLLLSGIMTDQWDELKLKLQTYSNWRVLDTCTLNSWQAVLLQKSN